jgi:hypothetical protein
VQAHVIAHLGTAVRTPQPGQQSMPSREKGTRAGKARNPDSTQQVNTLAALGEMVVPYRGAPEPNHAPGDQVRRRHPVLGLGITRRWGAGEWDQENRGQHGELVAVASTPRGEQTRISTVRGNTFRLPPAPWDAAHFVGNLQPNEE